MVLDGACTQFRGPHCLAKLPKDTSNSLRPLRSGQPDRLVAAWGRARQSQRYTPRTMPKKKGKKKTKAQNQQALVDALVQRLDTAQALANTATEGDVSALLNVIKQKKGELTALGQRPAAWYVGAYKLKPKEVPDFLAALRPSLEKKITPALSSPSRSPAAPLGPSEVVEDWYVGEYRLKTKEIREFIAALPASAKPDAAAAAAAAPKNKKLSKKEKKALKQQTLLDTLAQRLDTGRARVAAADATKALLQRARLSKLEELAAQEAEADQRHKDRQRAKASKVHAYASEVAALKKAVHALEEERLQLELEYGDADLRFQINERLRDEVGTVKRELEEEASERQVARVERETKAREARVAVARLGRETFRDLDPQYEVEARKRVEADVARAPERNARLTDRKIERASQARSLITQQRTLALALRQTTVEQSIETDMNIARDKRLEKASRKRADAEAEPATQQARLTEVTEAHAAAKLQRDACVATANQLCDVDGSLRRTRDSAVRRRTRAIKLAEALEKCASEREARAALERAMRSEEEAEAALAASESESDSEESYSNTSESSDDDYRAMWCS